MLLYVNVDISDFVILVLEQIIDTLESVVWLLESIIIFDGSDFGIGDFIVSLFDFSIADRKSVV